MAGSSAVKAAQIPIHHQPQTTPHPGYCLQSLNGGVRREVDHKRRRKFSFLSAHKGFKHSNINCLDNPDKDGTERPAWRGVKPCKPSLGRLLMNTCSLPPNPSCKSGADQKKADPGLLRDKMVLQPAWKIWHAEEGQGTDHVFLACHKVNAPPTQLSPIIGIMPPAIYASVAYVVNRSGIGSATEAALEFAAPVHKVHVGVHVRRQELAQAVCSRCRNSITDANMEHNLLEREADDRSLLYGTMLSVQRINRGLALPVSRTTKRACVVGGLGYWFPDVRYSSDVVGDGEAGIGMEAYLFGLAGDAGLPGPGGRGAT
ncbi:MAG: hypothetical protein FRX49_05807 [Trebouxia sp. A1-2]|nr:MAG: hypothetical protein FRX49_05807 [Trebouxia sp. A1-2]